MAGMSFAMPRKPPWIGWKRSGQGPNPCPPINVLFSKYAGKDDIPWLLWWWIEQALDYFERNLPYAQAKGERRSRLLSVAEKAKSLLVEIEASPTAETM